MKLDFRETNKKFLRRQKALLQNHDRIPDLKHPIPLRKLNHSTQDRAIRETEAAL